MWCFFILFILLISNNEFVRSTEFNLSMPNIRPSKDDQYICRAVDVSDDTYYINTFSAHSPEDAAHHILVVTCVQPGSFEDHWDCLEMDSSVKGICAEENLKLIYAWNQQAAPVRLPEDTSFKVGKGTGRNFIVMQIHYKDSSAFKNNPQRTDSSGITIQYSKKPTSKLANLLTSISFGIVPNGGISFIDMACRHKLNVPIHPFSFRVHAHTHGLTNIGYRVRNNQWELIGKQSPQDGGAFNPMENKNLVIDQGDYIASRCIFENNDGQDVAMGATRADEMCNYYILYWIPADMEGALNDIKMNTCLSEGWPYYSWNDTFNPMDIPEEAATNVKTGEVLYETVKVEKQYNPFDNYILSQDQE